MAAQERLLILGLAHPFGDFLIILLFLFDTLFDIVHKEIPHGNGEVIRETQFLINQSKHQVILGLYELQLVLYQVLVVYIELENALEKVARVVGKWGVIVAVFDEGVDACSELLLDELAGFFLVLKSLQPGWVDVQTEVPQDLLHFSVVLLFLDQDLWKVLLHLRLERVFGSGQE